MHKPTHPSIASPHISTLCHPHNFCHPHQMFVQPQLFWWNFRNGCRHFYFWSLLWLESQFFGYIIFGLKLLPLLIQSQFLLTSTNYTTFPYFSPSPSNLQFLVTSFLMSSSRQSVGRPEFHVPVAGQGLPPAQTLRLRLPVKAAVDRPCEETWQEPAGWCPSSLAKLKKP